MFLYDEAGGEGVEAAEAYDAEGCGLGTELSYHKEIISHIFLNVRLLRFLNF